MFLSHTVRFLTAAALIAVATTTAPAAFLTPDGSTAPFEDWSRGDANSLYAEWDTYSSAFGSPNSPDVGFNAPAGTPTGGDATVTGNEPSAFIVSSGNIYSFSAPTDFTLASPNYGNGAGWNTRVAVQLATQGSPLDLDSVQLTYNDGSGDVVLDAAYYADLNSDPAGPGGFIVEHLFVFDIAGFNPATFQVDFIAAASSMSLDKVVLDTYTTTGALSALPQVSVVPEPASAALLALGGLTACVRRPRNRRSAHQPA